jgi:hypothetical protein
MSSDVDELRLLRLAIVTVLVTVWVDQRTALGTMQTTYFLETG